MKHAKLSSLSVSPGSYSGNSKMRIAYFTNRYPAVSHTFIRREIRALESLGISVLRFALRSGADLVDDEDKSEAKQTRFVLKANLSELFRCCVTALLTQPLTIISVIRQALLMGWHSESGVVRHLAYVVEAAVLADWCRRDGIQHIHAHFGTNSAAVAMLSNQFCGIPYSFTAHGPDEFEMAPLLSLGEKLARAEFVVCVSSFGRSQYMRWSPPDLWQKIAVVHCGVDQAFFERPVDPPPASPRLVCVGRLDERKAQILLVAAASRLLEEGTRCEIVLAGDGEMRPNIEEAIRRAGLQESFTITGWVSGERVKAELQAARAMVLPSFSENMPVAIMEAMALGRPVISTYVAGIPELVKPGKTGWLVPAGDEVALAEAMREVLAAPVAQLAAMGIAGRRHILDQHDIHKEAKKLKRLLERSVAAA
jgi:glycosyltransferase involved in cell wall biosynthesis